MSYILDNQRVLVVGAGGLLGAKVVKNILSKGAKVIAADLDVDILKEKLLVQDIDLTDTSLEIVRLDITCETDVKSFFEGQGGITGAVNSSYPRNKTYGEGFFDVSLKSFNENLSLHLGSAFLFTQQCAVYFGRQDSSSTFSLVNISSIYGVIAPKFEIYENTLMTMPVEYAAIKSAILHLSKYVASYINDSRFRINCISPGGLFDNQPSVFLEAYKKKTHGSGMLDVQEVVGSIVFLLSDQSKFVTGQNIIIDDGFSL